MEVNRAELKYFPPCSYSDCTDKGEENKSSVELHLRGVGAISLKTFKNTAHFYFLFIWKELCLDQLSLGAGAFAISVGPHRRDEPFAQGLAPGPLWRRTATIARVLFASNCVDLLRNLGKTTTSSFLYLWYEDEQFWV